MSEIDHDVDKEQELYQEEARKKFQFDKYIYTKLKQAENQADSTDKRFSSEEILSEIKSLK